MGNWSPKLVSFKRLISLVSLASVNLQLGFRYVKYGRSDQFPLTELAETSELPDHTRLQDTYSGPGVHDIHVAVGWVGFADGLKQVFILQAPGTES